MSLEKKDFSNYIKAFNFRELFNDMGWNNDKTTQPIVQLPLLNQKQKQVL